LSQLSHLAHQLKPADWVQLFGTITSAFLAVGGAISGAIIGVNLGNKNARKVQQEEANHQLERDRQTEAVRLKAMLQALREELSVSWNIYVLQVGQMLENAIKNKGQPLPSWDCYGDYFVVFKANAGNLGMIKSDPLRKALVAAYIFAEGHIETYQTYNRFLANYRNSNPASLTPDFVNALGSLQDYHPRLIRSHNALKALAKECCGLLDTELKTPPDATLLNQRSCPRRLSQYLNPRRFSSDEIGFSHCGRSLYRI
jgi:hypothetical protein